MQQPATCRDAWVVILVYAQMIPVFQDGVSNASQSDQQGESEDATAYYTGIVYIVWSTAGVDFLLSGVSLFVIT